MRLMINKLLVLGPLTWWDWLSTTNVKDADLLSIESQVLGMGISNDVIFGTKEKNENDCNQLTERNDWPTAKSRKTSTSHWTTKTLNSSPNQLRIILNDSVKVTMEIRIHLWNIYKTIEIDIHGSISIDILILIKIFPFLIKLNVMIISWWSITEIPSMIKLLFWEIESRW